MEQYDEMFTFVEERLKDVTPEITHKLKIKYSRYEHTVRVYGWMKRICAGLSPEIVISNEVLSVATLFHDIGYGLIEHNHCHAQDGAKICRQYLEENGYNNEFIKKVTYLIENHSNKKLLADKDTPIELIILMEADLMDDTGALGIVMDSMITGAGDDPDFIKAYEHIRSYSYREMEENPMVTEVSRCFWNEKQKLTQEFIRQLRMDLNITGQ